MVSSTANADADVLFSEQTGVRIDACCPMARVLNITPLMAISTLPVVTILVEFDRQ